MKEKHALATLAAMPFVSIVTHGEMQALAFRDSETAASQPLLNLSVAVPLPTGNVIDAYARIDHYCVQNGLSVGKNDRDFDPLHGLFLQRDEISVSASCEVSKR